MGERWKGAEREGKGEDGERKIKRKQITRKGICVSMLKNEDAKGRGLQMDQRRDGLHTYTYEGKIQ